MRPRLKVPRGSDMTTDGSGRSAQSDVAGFFDGAAERLGLSSGFRKLLVEQWRELRVALQVRMEDGRIEV